jgi:transposase
MEHYIGIDLHKAFFQACVMGSDGEREWEERFRRTATGIDAFLAQVPRPCAVAVEASGPTWAFADAITDGVDELVIVDAAKTRLRAGYAAKTDRLDAQRLADALRRSSVVSIYFPPSAVRELRELCRYRMGLGRLVVSLKQRVHALLLRQGIESPALSDLFGTKGTAWLDTVVLPPRAADALSGLRALLADAMSRLERVDQEVDIEAKRDAIAQRLDAIYGIGAVLALALRAEIGTINRFSDGAHLASYAGLVPYVSQSASHCRYGRITKRGSPHLRWALIEAAMHARRRADAYGRWARRLALRKGVLKARVGSARVLCDEIVRVWRAAV